MAGRAAQFDKRTLRERCRSYVREQIISGRMAPGEHVVETQLSRHLGVSRGTLREALRSLENEGLLVDDGRGHLRIRAVTAAEIRDVFRVRSALEALAAVQLAQRSDHEQTATQLRDALLPLRDDAMSFASQMRHDLRFHELLCESTGNTTLLRSWQHLRGQIEMMIIAAGPQVARGRMRYEQHVQIAETIEAGNADEARGAVLAHMESFSSKYLGDIVS